MISFNLVVVLSMLILICGATLAGADEVNITLISTFETDGQASGIELNSEYAYIADGENGLVVVDVSNLSTPTLAGSCDVNGSADNIAIEGDHAYVTGADSGLRIIDISNPSSPVLISSYDTEGTERGIAVSEGYAYLANGRNGLVIVDVSNSSSPIPAGNFSELDFCACDIAVENDHAYVASKSGLYIFDVSNPESPTLTGINNPGFYIMDFEFEAITVSGNRSYSIDSYNRLFIDNVSDSSSPNTYKNSTACSPAASIPANVGIVVLGNYAYAGSEHFGIVNVSDPSSPFIAGYYDTPGAACGIAVSGEYAYVTDENGLVILRVENADQIAESLQVDILNPEDGLLIDPDDSVLIQVKVTDNNGNLFNGSGKISVQVSFNNTANSISLFDDGVHNDENVNDGIYANEWTPENVSNSDEIEYTIAVFAQDSTLEGMTNEVSGVIVFDNEINNTTTDADESQVIDSGSNEDDVNEVTISSSHGESSASTEESGEDVYKDVVSEMKSTNDTFLSEVISVVSESGIGSFESGKEQESPETNEFYNKKWAFGFVIASLIGLFVLYFRSEKRR